MLPDVKQDEWAHARQLLRDYMERERISQTEAGERMGVSQSAVSQFVDTAPKWKPSVPFLAGLARLLQHPIEDLLPPRLRDPHGYAHVRARLPTPAEIDESILRLRQLAADIYIALDREEADAAGEDRRPDSGSPERSGRDRRSR